MNYHSRQAIKRTRWNGWKWLKWFVVGQRQIDFSMRIAHTGQQIRSNLLGIGSVAIPNDSREIHIYSAVAFNQFHFAWPHHNGLTSSGRSNCAVQNSHSSANTFALHRWIRSKVGNKIKVEGFRGMFGGSCELSCHWLSTPSNTLNFLSNHSHQQQQQPRQTLTCSEFQLLHSIYFPSLRSWLVWHSVHLPPVSLRCHSYVSELAS